jgi:phospholipase C
MKRSIVCQAMLTAALGVLVSHAQTRTHAKVQTLAAIQTIVVIYAENRSFDNLYGHFPGANGLQIARPELVQLDRDDTPLKELPPVWGRLTAKRVTPPVTGTQTAHLPNKPFAIDDPNGFNQPLSVATRDLWHRFYENQMQIDDGKNDKFVAYADSGALVMGYYDGSQLPLWKIAQKYTLADNFFTGHFGGSFSNHFELICACTPYYSNADKSPAKGSISVVEEDGVTLMAAPNSPASALYGPPKFVNSGNLTPDFYAINTMEPPYQPSANKPAPNGDSRFADPDMATTLPPQHEVTIGDLLSLKGVSWAWYAGGWRAALEGKGGAPVPNFQFHQQPFNYFAQYAPGTKAREEHLRDGGMNGEVFIKAIDDGKLPQVTFYKPQGNLTEHPGYADVLDGDTHIADVVSHLEKSPQWEHMVVIVTYDENGGFWDHVAPPKADRWGPGTRIPTIIISPLAKKGTVDHTLYDTTSILRFITRKFELPVLHGLVERDEALHRNDEPPIGDLTAALELPR